MVDIDVAVARDRRRKAEKAARGPPDEPPADEEPPMRGECAVCGRPVPATLPPHKDPATPRFCDEHDEDDLRAMEESFQRRRREQEARRAEERYRQR